MPQIVVKRVHGTHPPRNAPTGFFAGGTEPRFGADASWRTTLVVEIRRRDECIRAAEANERAAVREVAILVMVAGEPVLPVFAGVRSRVRAYA